MSSTPNPQLLEPPKTLIPGKPVWESWTVWGTALYAAAESAAQLGLLPPLACNLVKVVGAALGVLGLRRALG